jgi:hypothetical protein
VRVDLSGHNFVFPNECACCGAAPDGELTVSASRSWGSKVVHTETKSWDFPYCTGCIRHIRAVEAAGSLARLLTFLSILLAVLVGFGVGPYWGAAIGILAVVGTVVVYGKRLRQARAECGANCVDADKAIVYLGWYGTLHRFEIGSQHFARDFMTANQNKLVNLSSEARTLLSSSGSGFKPSASRSPRRYVS